MLKNKNTIPNTTTYQPHFLLDFTCSFENDVPQDDISRSVIQITERININNYVDLRNRNSFGYDGVMMFKLVLLAFAEKGYCSTRDLADLCRFDIRYKFIAQGIEPSHSSFQRFLHDDVKGSIEDIFYEVNRIMEEELAIDTSVLLVDGSKFEANANKNTFIWRKNTKKHYAKNWKKANEAMKKLNRYFEEEQWKVTCSILKEPSIAYLLEVCEELETIIKDKKIEFIHGKGKRKTQIQKYYEELRDIALKLWEYTIQYDLLDGRNSCSKTDPDATFMHMKYDYYNHTNVFKPGYNVQLGISEGYIREVYVSGDCNDVKTYRPLLENYYQVYGNYPKKVVADAGYGSYDNYYYSEIKGIKAYVTYSGYYKEKKNSKKDKYKNYRFQKDENGIMRCPLGEELDIEKVTMDHRSEYPKMNISYQCKSCNSCRSRSSCTKSENGRSITRCQQLERYHKEVKERVESDEGKKVLRERRIYSEGAFGILKEDFKYTKLRRRGESGVKSEILLVCMGFNLRKYTKEMTKKRKEMIN